MSFSVYWHFIYEEKWWIGSSLLNTKLMIQPYMNIHSIWLNEKRTWTHTLYIKKKKKNLSITVHCQAAPHLHIIEALTNMNKLTRSKCIPLYTSMRQSSNNSLYDSGSVNSSITASIFMVIMERGRESEPFRAIHWSSVIISVRPFVCFINYWSVSCIKVLNQ